MQFVLKSALIALTLVGVALADGIKPYALANDGAVTRDRHLSEISDIMRGGRGGYIDLGFYYIMIDGGGNAETIPLCAKAGANQFVAGSYLFGQSDMRAAVADLRAKLRCCKA